MPTRLVPIAGPPIGRIETEETTTRQLVGCVSPRAHASSSSSAAFDSETPELDNSDKSCRSVDSGGRGDTVVSSKAPRGRRSRGMSRSWDLFSRGGKSSDSCSAPMPPVPIFVNLGGVGGQQGQRQNLAVAGCVLQLSAHCEYGNAAGVGGHGGDAGATTKPAPRKSDDSSTDSRDKEPHHPGAKLLLTTIASPLVMVTKEIEADGHKCIWNQTFRIELPCDALTTATMLRVDLAARAHHGGLVRAASGRVALSEVRGNGREVGRARAGVINSGSCGVVFRFGGSVSRLLVAAQQSPAVCIRIHQTKPRRSAAFFCACGLS